MSPRFWQLLATAETSTVKGRALIEALGPFERVTAAQFAESPLLNPGEAKRVAACGVEAIDSFIAGGGEVLYGDQLPVELAPLEQPPLAMFLAGKRGALDGTAVGIVGTRNASAYGRNIARKFGAAVAEAGGCVVSGGALGIDAAAHEGAVSANGQTVAVLAGGVDKPYPARNAALFRKIQEKGCLVSTFPCGSIPQPYRFLVRNEIIAALSDAILVIEAPAQSGALTTAIAARKLGKPVFAVPANIESDSFRGSHQLIREGATLVDTPEHLLNAVGLFALTVQRVAEPVSELAARILKSLTTKPVPAEKLAEQVGISPQELMAEMTMLELDGRVTRELGGYALVP